MKIIKNFTTFVKEVKGELKKVSWSSRDEVIGSTSVVIITVALLSVFIGVVDFILARIVSILIR